MTKRDYVRLSTALSRGRRALELHGAMPALLIGFDNAVHVLASDLAEGNVHFERDRFVANSGAQP